MGIQNYHDIWHMMQNKNLQKSWDGDTLLLLEHYPVYTLGSQGGLEHLIKPTNIDIVHTDRGGSITYHGPGQLMIYPLIDMRHTAVRLSLWINTLEACLMDFMSPYIPHVHTIEHRRGVYVANKKIASIGLRIANGRSYHGACLNIACDLRPFDNINPCGYPEMSMTQWTEYHTIPENWYDQLEEIFCSHFKYTTVHRELTSVRVTPECQIAWPR